MATRILLTLIAGLFLASCGEEKAPSAAHVALGKALSALAAGNRPGFKEMVVPAQRSGELGIESQDGFPDDVTAKTRTLDDLLAMPFFTKVKGARADIEADSQVTETSARLIGLLEYANDSVAKRMWAMVKRDGAWLIDMKATIRLWQIANGPDAFVALKRIKK